MLKRETKRLTARLLTSFYTDNVCHFEPRNESSIKSWQEPQRRWGGGGGGGT